VNITHAKATRELEYQPRPLYDSIRDAVKWFMESGFDTTLAEQLAFS
jgi:nucleoside-diphosphate-sugar epimerase